MLPTLSAANVHDNGRPVGEYVYTKKKSMTPLLFTFTTCHKNGRKIPIFWCADGCGGADFFHDNVRSVDNNNNNSCCPTIVRER